MSNVLSFCIICYTQTIDSKDGICSKKCRDAEKSILEFTDEILDHQNTEDSRVYFYDIGLGSLIDMYVIHTIKFYEENTFSKAETKYYLSKLYESIMTKINRSARNSYMKIFINQKMKELFMINYRMWKMRELRDIKYFDLCDQRDVIKNEIDMTVEGRSRINRVYAHRSK